MSRAVVRAAVAGAQGRMGRAVAAALLEAPEFALAGLFSRPDAPPAPPLVSRDAALSSAQVVIDFTTAAASTALAQACAARGGPALVIGSTGFTPEEDLQIQAAASRCAIVKSGNFSLGVNLLARLVRQAAAALPAALYDIEIFEAHHRRKIDAPSGTALLLGGAAADGRGAALPAVRAPQREGVTGPRAEGQIGFSVMRGGGIVGEHQVVFAGDDEIITLAHSARDRTLFVRGALAAAAFAAHQPPGLYDMQDVIGALEDRS